MVLNVTLQTHKYTQTFNSMLLDKKDYKIQIMYMLTLVFHIHAWNWILNQNQYKSPDYICHLGTPTFHFCLSPFCKGRTVYLENHRMWSTFGLRGSSFLLTGFHSYFFVCCHSSLPPYLLFLCLH